MATKIPWTIVALGGLAAGVVAAILLGGGGAKTPTAISVQAVKTGTGETRMVSGALKDASGAPVGGATVRIKINQNEYDDFQTEADGSFSFQYTPAVEGDYRIEAIFDGDQELGGSSAVTTFTVTGDGGIAPYYVVSSSGNVTLYSDGSLKYSGTPGAAIQWALNNLPSRTTKYKVLLNGTFAITSPITPPSYSIIELRGSVSGPAPLVSKVGAGNDIEITGGAWTATPSTQAAIILSGGSYGVGNVYPLKNIGVIGCTLKNPISILNCDGGLITENDISGHGRVSSGPSAGITLGYNNANLEISYNHIHDSLLPHGSGGGGIYLYPKYYQPGEAGIGYEIHHIDIIGNLIERVDRDGISLYPDQKDYYAPPHFDMVRDCFVEGNVIRNCQYQTVEEPRYHFTALGVGWGGSGLSDTNANLGAWNNVIINNLLENNLAYGLKVRGDGNIVRCNRIVNQAREPLGIGNGGIQGYTFVKVNGIPMPKNPNYLQYNELVGRGDIAIVGTSQGNFMNYNTGVTSVNPGSGNITTPNSSVNDSSRQALPEPATNVYNQEFVLDGPIHAGDQAAVQVVLKDSSGNAIVGEPISFRIDYPDGSYLYKVPGLLIAADDPNNPSGEMNCNRGLCTGYGGTQPITRCTNCETCNGGGMRVRFYPPMAGQYKVTFRFWGNATYRPVSVVRTLTVL